MSFPHPQSFSGGSWVLSVPQEPGVCLAPPGVSGVGVLPRVYLSLQFAFTVAFGPLGLGSSHLGRCLFPLRVKVSERNTGSFRQRPWVRTSALSLCRFMSSDKQTPKRDC